MISVPLKLRGSLPRTRHPVGRCKRCSGWSPIWCFKDLWNCARYRLNHVEESMELAVSRLQLHSPLCWLVWNRIWRQLSSCTTRHGPVCWEHGYRLLVVFAGSIFNDLCLLHLIPTICILFVFVGNRKTSVLDFAGLLHLIWPPLSSLCMNMLPHSLRSSRSQALWFMPRLDHCKRRQ